MINVQPEVGVIYGNYKMDKYVVSEFIAWLIRESDPLGHVLTKHQIGSCEFNAAWQDFSQFSEFELLQNKFMGVKTYE